MRCDDDDDYFPPILVATPFTAVAVSTAAAVPTCAFPTFQLRRRTVISIELSGLEEWGKLTPMLSSS